MLSVAFILLLGLLVGKLSAAPPTNLGQALPKTNTTRHADFRAGHSNLRTVGADHRYPHRNSLLRATISPGDCGYLYTLIFDCPATTAGNPSKQTTGPSSRTTNQPTTATTIAIAHTTTNPPLANTNTPTKTLSPVAASLVHLNSTPISTTMTNRKDKCADFDSAGQFVECLHEPPNSEEMEFRPTVRIEDEESGTPLTNEPTVTRTMKSIQTHGTDQADSSVYSETNTPMYTPQEAPLASSQTSIAVQTVTAPSLPVSSLAPQTGEPKPTFATTANPLRALASSTSGVARAATLDRLLLLAAAHYILLLLLL